MRKTYDIYFLLKHYTGGVKTLADEFLPVRDTRLVMEWKAKLSDKFASPEHGGPIDVVNFLEMDEDEERDLIKREAFEQVQALMSFI